MPDQLPKLPDEIIIDLDTDELTPDEVRWLENWEARNGLHVENF